MYLHFYTAYNRVFYFRFFLCVPCFQRIFIQKLSLLQLVLCRVAAVKRLPVHHHSADYIVSGPLGSLRSF